MSALRKHLDDKYRRCLCGSVDITEDNHESDNMIYGSRQIVIRCKKCDRSSDPVHYTPTHNGLARARAVIAARKKWNAE